MQSIGNDIVDLNIIDKARTRSFPFYSKILSLTEQNHYQALPANSIPFETYTWLLWSAKEAIYKFAKRHQHDLVFSPRKIELNSESELTEFQNKQNLELTFIFQNLRYCTSSIITPGYIATIANHIRDFSVIDSDVIKISSSEYQDQSAAVREHFLQKLALIYPARFFEITKSNIGYPMVLSSGYDTGITASFAHHGNYVAYAMKRT